MKKTPGIDSTTIFGVSVGGKDGLLEDNGGRGPGRPRYGQHHLHRLKPLLIQLPQQHHHHPSSCVMNILLSLCPEPLCIKQENDLTKKQLFISRVSLGGKWEWTARYQLVYLGDALIMIQTQTGLCESQQTKHLLVSIECNIKTQQNMSEQA